ncbi:hypothetical protein CR513_51049, partial [Mucuna pruriens]
MITLLFLSSKVESQLKRHGKNHNLPLAPTRRVRKEYPRKGNAPLKGHQEEGKNTLLLSVPIKE